MKGFTLVEVLVVMAITVLLTGFMIQNFSRSRVDLNQTRQLILDAIREAQSLALSGSVFSASRGVTGTYRCGYGIHFTSTGYTIYAGPNSESVDCSAQDRNYNPGTDDVVRAGILSNNVLEIGQPADDIFFEPPDPVTYINNSRAPNASTDIRIYRKGAACPSVDCRTINVTTSGLIMAK